jgi:hypothetical protein
LREREQNQYKIVMNKEESGELNEKDKLLLFLRFSRDFVFCDAIERYKVLSSPFPHQLHSIVF